MANSQTLYTPYSKIVAILALFSLLAKIALVLKLEIQKYISFKLSYKG